MKTVTSVSGGQSSAYIAANYPSDFLVFALVTTEDLSCKHPDSKLRQMVSDKIGREFIGTLEENVIIETILELEQWLEQEIHWVAGKPFEDIIDKKGGYLPNIMARYCTTEMKIDPMFKWWKETIGEPVKMQIGFRAGEERRAKNMLDKCVDGLRQYKKVGWQKPSFPLIDNGIKRDRIVEYWDDILVPFAKQNNCVGCFHRNPLVLRKKFDDHPEKMEWFKNQELKHGGTWKSELSYSEIQKHKPQTEINFDEWSCDSGHCGL
tara:strand:- start:2524 stop:3315 length:792 start_codon:yes stop_codon:yes gene_type:complete